MISAAASARPIFTGLLTDTERDVVHELLRVAGETGEILLDVDSQIYNMLGRLEKLGPLQRKSLNINASEWEITEL